MKSNSNRKSIPLHKKNELVINKNLVQNVFSTSLNENMQTYLEIDLISFHELFVCFGIDNFDFKML